MGVKDVGCWLRRRASIVMLQARSVQNSTEEHFEHFEDYSKYCINDVVKFLFVATLEGHSLFSDVQNLKFPFAYSYLTFPYPE